MSRYASLSVRGLPGDLASAVRNPEALAMLEGAGNVVCVLGRPSLAEPSESVLDAAVALLEVAPGTRFLSGLRRANVHGALDMGLAPGMLPGRVTLDDAGEWFGAAWGADLPGERGLDATGILSAAAEGRIQGLVLLGADPLSDFPDRDLARRALQGAGVVIAVDTFLNASVREADVVLPAAMAGEKSGSTTNLEGRVSRLNQKINPPGTAWSDWMIAVELAHRLGADLGFESVAQITDEIAKVAPAYAGITAAALASASGFNGLLAGAVEDRVADGPPAMSRGDAPEIHSPEVHGDSSIGQADGATAEAPERPDPSDRSEPHGDEDSEAEAEALVAADAGDVAEAVERSEEAGDSVADPAGGHTDRDWPNRPDPVRHAPVVSSRSVPAVDSYSLRLVAGHRLYDGGTLTQQSPSLAPLASGTTLRVNPADLERLGVTSGDSVRVTSSRTSLVLPTEADDAVPKGVAALPFDQPGSGAADLVDATAAVTDVRVETL